MKKMKILLMSLVISACVSVALLAVASAIITKVEILPKGTAVLITTVIGCAAVFSGALVSSSYAKENGALIGLLGGAVFVLITVVVSAFVFNNDFTADGAGKAAAYLLSGVIGGILGVNRKKKVKF